MENLHMIFKMPPSTNDLWGYTKGRVYLKAGGTAYHAHVATMLSRFDIAPNINMPVEVEILTHFPDRKKHDIDNIVKILFDSFTSSGFWEDDELVSKFSVERGVIQNPSTIEVSVKPYKVSHGI